MNKKTILLGLYLLSGATEVSARLVPLSQENTHWSLNNRLLEAALAGDIPKMRVLIAHGADVNSQQFSTYARRGGLEIGTSRQTILIRLLSRSYVDLEILKFLIQEAKANPSLKDSLGYDAFAYVADNADKELHAILNSSGKKST